MRSGTRRYPVSLTESVKANKPGARRLANVRGYFLLITLSIIWGLAFVAIRRADFELSPVNLTLLRWLIVSAGFLVLYPFAVRPKAKLERKDIPRLAVVAMANVVVYHISLNTAESQVDASLAGLLISLAPLMTVLLSSAVLHEKIRERLWLALALAMAGSVIISVPDFSLGSTTAEGPVLVAVASAASAVYTVASKPLTTKYGPLAISAWSALLGTAFLVPLLSPSLVAQAQSLSPSGWASVLYLALLSTVFANSIYFTLVSRQQVSRLGVQLFLVPVVSAAGGVLILSESISLATFAGGAVLLVAVGLATLGRR
jgi:drug/metabolite transporter (DMT)-like permease